MFDIGSLFDIPTVRIIVIPLLIFLARIADVSFGTLRMVFISRGTKEWAALLGFFEVLIWLIAITYILQNLTSVTTYLAYAGGFAAGNYLGLLIEEKMAVGLLGVTIITHHDAKRLIAHLRERRYGITSVSAMGATGKVRIVFSIIRRKDLEKMREIVEEFHPNAFIAIQNVRAISKQVYPYPERPSSQLFRWWRKSK